MIASLDDKVDQANVDVAKATLLAVKVIMKASNLALQRNGGSKALLATKKIKVDAR